MKHLITMFCLLMALPVEMFLNARAQEGPKNVSNYVLSGPYTHKNLTVFLVHGKDRTTKTFLTLEEALAQKKVRVYETKDVNELAIRNVQSGEIVRGGDQDRMISTDFIVPPEAGRMPIAAFCVESGRWSRRGSEPAETFASSSNSAATKDLKLAAKRDNSQQAVWENVAVAQKKLSENVGASVKVVTSASSLELSVENSKVKDSTAAYINALAGLVRNKPDVIGYVFAINGEINSADVYASHALFAKLWPKLLKASSVEAVAELKPNLVPKPVVDEHIRDFLAESEQANAATKEVTARVRLVTREDDKNILFETQDHAQKDGWVHRNYIRKQ